MANNFSYEHLVIYIFLPVIYSLLIYPYNINIYVKYTIRTLIFILQLLFFIYNCRKNNRREEQYIFPENHDNGLKELILLIDESECKPIQKTLSINNDNCFICLEKLKYKKYKVIEYNCKHQVHYNCHKLFMKRDLKISYFKCPLCNKKQKNIKI